MTLLVPPFVLFSLLVSVTSQIIERGSPSCLVFAQCSECQSGEANDWRNRELVLDLFSNLKNGKDPVETLVHLSSK